MLTGYVVLHQGFYWFKKVINISNTTVIGECECDENRIGVDCSGTEDDSPEVNLGGQECIAANGCTFIQITGIFLEVETIVCVMERLQVDFGSMNS